LEVEDFVLKEWEKGARALGLPLEEAIKLAVETYLQIVYRVEEKYKIKIAEMEQELEDCRYQALMCDEALTECECKLKGCEG